MRWRGDDHSISDLNQSAGSVRASVGLDLFPLSKKGTRLLAYPGSIGKIGTSLTRL